MISRAPLPPPLPRVCPPPPPPPMYRDPNPPPPPGGGYGAPPPPPPPGCGYGPPPPPPPPGGGYGPPPPPPPPGGGGGYGPPPPPPPPGGGGFGPPPPPPPPGGGGFGPPPPPPPPGGGGGYGPPPPPPLPGGAPPPPLPPGGAPPPPPPPGGAPGPPPPPGAPRAPGGPPPPPGLGRGGPLGGRGRGRAAVKKSNLKPLHWNKVTRAVQGSLWEELQRIGEPQSASEFDVKELETLFSAIVPKKVNPKDAEKKPASTKVEKIHLIDLRRANNTEIMLTKVKMPLPDMVAAILALDDEQIDSDQVENCLKFCPTKEEMEQLKNFTGDYDTLGKCEQYFVELMKVPRMEAKLRVFLFKIQFNNRLSEFRKSLNTVQSACDEVHRSIKLKEILKRILFLGNTLNQGTARGSAVGFKLDSLLKLTDTRSTTSNMTLMHYLCKILASKSPTLLDFHEDLVSLEAASKIQLKVLAEEMQAILSGLKKVKQELEASANDGPVSEGFHRTVKEFVGQSEAEVTNVTNFYAVVCKNADALALYFGEDPARFPFEQATLNLLNFVRVFRECHEENIKQAEHEKMKAEKMIEMEKEMTNYIPFQPNMPKAVHSLTPLLTNPEELRSVKLTNDNFMVDAILAMDEKIIASNHLELCLNFYPTKEDMEQLKNFTGNYDKLSKREQYVMELMRVPRMEAKLRVFLFKIRFNAQISEFKESLNTVNTACDEVWRSIKLKEIMKRILYMQNKFNQATAKGAVSGSNLDSLLKSTNRRASNSNMTIVHYLCKILASKSPTLLDFHKDLVSLEAATKIQLKVLAEQWLAIIRGKENAKQELAASANDGPISNGFHKTLMEFYGQMEVEVTGVTDFYFNVCKKADALAIYIGEDPTCCPFEQVALTLLNFVRLFRKCDEVNRKQEEVKGNIVN